MPSVCYNYICIIILYIILLYIIIYTNYGDLGKALQRHYLLPYKECLRRASSPDVGGCLVGGGGGVVPDIIISRMSSASSTSNGSRGSTSCKPTWRVAIALRSSQLTLSCEGRRKRMGEKEGERGRREGER